MMQKIVWRYSRLHDFHNIFIWRSTSCQKTFIVRSSFFILKFLLLERTRYFCFLHLNFTITRSFFFIRWQAFRLSSSTITISNNAKHPDCSGMMLALSYGTGLISRVSLQLFWGLFELLRCNWIMHSSRISLRRLERNVTVAHFVF